MPTDTCSLELWAPGALEARMRQCPCGWGSEKPALAIPPGEELKRWARTGLGQTFLPHRLPYWNFRKVPGDSREAEGPGSHLGDVLLRPSCQEEPPRLGAAAPDLSQHHLQDTFSRTPITPAPMGLHSFRLSLSEAGQSEALPLPLCSFLGTQVSSASAIWASLLTPP